MKVQTQPNKEQPPIKEIDVSGATTSGKLTGVLLNSGLVLFRGSNIVVAQCHKFQQINTSTQGTSIVTQPMSKPCSQSCIMFGEPCVAGEGVELEICDGRKLKFHRLLDLRGQINDIDVRTCTNNELFEWLKKNNVIQTN